MRRKLRRRRTKCACFCAKAIRTRPARRDDERRSTRRTALQIGDGDARVMALIAAKTGLTGRAVIVVLDEHAAARVRRAIDDAGALAEVGVVDQGVRPDDASFDVIVVHDVRADHRLIRRRGPLRMAAAVPPGAPQRRPHRDDRAGHTGRPARAVRRPVTGRRQRQETGTRSQFSVPPDSRPSAFWVIARASGSSKGSKNGLVDSPSVP